MGKNKLAKFADMDAFEHVFQVKSTELREGKQFELKGNWGQTFFKNNNPIVLELGCGKGEYTVGLAQMYPEKNFIGIDIKGARMWTGAKLSVEKKLENVAFVRTNIEMIDHFFGQNEVFEIWITFPDPQMKKTTKRLTATNFMALYKNILKPDGLVHLKTDSNFLYTYTCEMIKANSLTVHFENNNLYGSGLNDKILGIKTYYEQQWLERGLTIKYIKFSIDNQVALVEPDVDIEHDSYRSFGRSKRQHMNE